MVEKRNRNTINKRVKLFLLSMDGEVLIKINIQIYKIVLKTKYICIYRTTYEAKQKYQPL